MATIYKDEDRFFGGIEISYPDGSKTIEARPIEAILQRLPFRKVPVTRGMDIVSFAAKEYKNVAENPSELWWLIAQANGIDNPNEFDILLEGQEAIVPDYVEYLLLS